jgi:Ras-related protein Rab-1A
MAAGAARPQAAVAGAATTQEKAPVVKIMVLGASCEFFCAAPVRDVRPRAFGRCFVLALLNAGVFLSLSRSPTLSLPSLSLARAPCGSCRALGVHAPRCVRVLELTSTRVSATTGSGKSCLIARYSRDEFHFNHMTTVGIDFATKSMSIDQRAVDVQLWDTAGQEQYSAITRRYVAGANGVLLVYDITQRDTFERVRKWIQTVDEMSSGPTVKVLVGNKVDLAAERKVEEKEGQELAKELNIEFFETSAKENINVAKAFEALATLAFRQLLVEDEAKQRARRDTVDLNKKASRSFFSCCSSQ